MQPGFISEQNTDTGTNFLGFILFVCSFLTFGKKTNKPNQWECFVVQPHNHTNIVDVGIV